MAYQRNKRSAAVLAAVMLMTAPAGMLAAETAPHVPNSVKAQESAERLGAFGDPQGYRGVTVSGSWLRQARLGGVMLNLRLYTPMGDVVTFREKLKAAPADVDYMSLYLLASQADDAITLQLDQPAVDTLNRLGIIEIVVADANRNVRARYSVSELEAVREALGLKDAEQLCVSGEDAPVTVVSEDGVRRQINP